MKITYLALALPLMALASCNSEKRSENGTAANSSGTSTKPPEVAKLDLPMVQTPTNGSDNTYCTIEENGSYDISVKDAGGNELVRFGRICINYREAISGNGSSARHTFDSHYTGNVVISNVRGGFGLTSEFFQAADPNIRLYLTTSVGRGQISCGMSNKPFISDTQELVTGVTRLILKNANSRGILHISVQYWAC